MPDLVASSVPKGRVVPTIDLSSFTNESSNDEQRVQAAQALVEALHSFGFAKVSGYGMSRQEVDGALGWVKRLFDLPTSEKMKAPHPPTPMPHRGYSGIGIEKVHSSLICSYLSIKCSRIIV